MVDICFLRLHDLWVQKNKLPTLAVRDNWVIVHIQTEYQLKHHMSVEKSNLLLWLSSPSPRAVTIIRITLQYIENQIQKYHGDEPWELTCQINIYTLWKEHLGKIWWMTKSTPKRLLKCFTTLVTLPHTHTHTFVQWCTALTCSAAAIQHFLSKASIMCLNSVLHELLCGVQLRECQATVILI